MGGWMDGRMDGWEDGWMDEKMDEGIALINLSIESEWGERDIKWMRGWMDK
jgi:hypothetical protein